MNGTNNFLRREGTGFQDQFRPENGIAMGNGVVPSTGQLHSGYPANGGMQQGMARCQTAAFSNGPGNQVTDAAKYQQGVVQYSSVPMPGSMMTHGGHSMLGSFSDPASPQQSKKRVARACDHCRKRKIKCDPVNPQTNRCSNCSKYGAECTFRVRDDGDRKKRAIEGLVTTGMIPEDLNILEFVPASGSGHNTVDYPADNIDRYESLPFGPRPFETSKRSDLSGRVEKLDRKVSHMSESLKQIGWMLETLMKNHEKKPDTQPRPKPKQYSTTLLTPQILIWVDKMSHTYGTEKTIIKPVRELLTIITKSYLLQMKAVTDFSVPFFRDGKYCLQPMPPRTQAKRIVESFRSAMLASTAPGLIMADYYTTLVDEYYTTENLSYAKLLLLNVSICFSASRMAVINSSDSYRLRKDRYDPSKEELRKIEHDMFLNSIYYYNRVSIGGPSLTGVQGLLLFSVYLQETLDTELAYATLSTAIRFAIDLGLNEISSYVNLTMDEEIMRRGLWWLCCNCDKVIAVLLSRPPLIKDQDMDMLSDGNYFTFARKMLELRKPVLKDEIRNLRDLDSCLNYMVDFCELLPMYLSYHVLKLVRYEAKIIENCFTVRSTSDCSFDETIDRTLALREDLENWTKTLHPVMQLNSYKNYISLLYVRDGIDNPAFTFETACSRVLRSHFRCMHVRILLSMFAVAFIVDNPSHCRGSRHQIMKIHQLFIEDEIDYCMRMLKLFQTVDYERHLYNTLLFSLLTGVFTLILYTVKNFDELPKARTTEIIQLLLMTHTHLIGDNGEYLVSHNQKWNASVFFYTTLLSAVLRLYNSRYSQCKEHFFDLNLYDSMLERIINYSNKMKNESIDRVITYMTEFGMLDDTDEESPVDTAAHLFPLSQNSALGLKNSTLRFFRSFKPFKILPTPSDGYQSLDEVHFGTSIFRTENLRLTEYPESFNPDNFAEDLMESDPILSAVDGASHHYEELEESFYPYAMFYDRDTKFSHRQASRLGQPYD